METVAAVAGNDVATRGDGSVAVIPDHACALVGHGAGTGSIGADAIADDAVITDDLSAGSLKAGTGSKVDKMLIGTVAVNPAEIAAGVKGGTAVTVTGAVAGDVVVANPPAALEAGLVPAGAYVSGADEVTIVLFNPTGAPVDGISRNWTYLLMSPEA